MDIDLITLSEGEHVVSKKKEGKAVQKRSITEGLLNPVEKAQLTHYYLTGEKSYQLDVDRLVKQTGASDHHEAYQAIQHQLFDHHDIPFHGPEIGTEDFTFIDLFAGIGGFRMALQNNNGRCVFSSEYDKYAQKTYFANYGEVPFGDITLDETKKFIPLNFDVLCGGFPCQPFSLAGVSKKNSLGRSHGFDDVKQGNLFFHIVEILETHRPKAFFLENVKNLVSHDKGNTFKVIKQTILDLGYSFDSRVIDGSYYVPQHRERTFMIGFDRKRYGEDVTFDFDRIILPDAKPRVGEILQQNIDPKYTLSDKLWQYLQDYAQKHKERGNGFGFGTITADSTTRTLSARYYKDGSEILVPQDGMNPRRLTPQECAALQGYPMYPINVDNPNASFRITVSDNQAYKQFGNSVVMPLIQVIGRQLSKHLNYLDGRNIEVGNRITTAI